MELYQSGFLVIIFWKPNLADNAMLHTSVSANTLQHDLCNFIDGIFYSYQSPANSYTIH